MGGPLYASKLVSSFNLTSSSDLPTESIIPFLDKDGLFFPFPDTKTILASSVTSPYPDIFYLDSFTDGFDKCEKKGGYKEGKGMIWGAGTGVFNLPYFSGLPTDSIVFSPDKSVVFP